jgi:hypothetical protein
MPQFTTQNALARRMIVKFSASVAQNVLPALMTALEQRAFCLKFFRGKSIKAQRGSPAQAPPPAPLL